MSSFLTGLISGGANAYMSIKGAQNEAEKEAKQNELLERMAGGKKVSATGPEPSAGGILGGDTPGFSGGQAPARIDTAVVNPVQKAAAEQAEMADEFKNITQ